MTEPELVPIVDLDTLPDVPRRRGVDWCICQAELDGIIAEDECVCPDYSTPDQPDRPVAAVTLRSRGTITPAERTGPAMADLTDADLLHGLRTDLSRGVELLLSGIPPLGPTERHERDRARDALTELLQRRTGPTPMPSNHTPVHYPDAW